MQASYADTIAFDLVVVFFVAILMPTSVLLLRSRSSTGKMGGAALLALSVLYVGGFEHYRLHAPEVRLALRAACAMRQRSRASDWRHDSASRCAPSGAAQVASERVRAMLQTDPARKRALADAAQMLPRRALLALVAAARGAR